MKFKWFMERHPLIKSPPTKISLKSNENIPSMLKSNNNIKLVMIKLASLIFSTM